MASDVFQQYDESRSFGGKYRLVQLQVRVREAHSVKPLEVGGKRGDSVSVSVSETVTHIDTHRHTQTHSESHTPSMCLCHGFVFFSSFAASHAPVSAIRCNRSRALC